MRPLVVVDTGEGLEASLLLQEVLSGRLGGFLLQGQVHTFVPAVLLWMSRFDALDRDPQTQPPHRQFAQAEEGAGAGEGDTVVAADGARQAIVLAGSLKDTEGEVLAGALQAFTAQQLARGEVRDGKG